VGFSTVDETERAPRGTELSRGEETKRRTCRPKRAFSEFPRRCVACRRFATTGEVPLLGASSTPESPASILPTDGPYGLHRGQPRLSFVQRSAKKRHRDANQGAFHRGDRELSSSPEPAILSRSPAEHL